MESHWRAWADGCARGRGRGAGLSQPPYQVHARLPAWRERGHHRATPWQRDVEEAPASRSSSRPSPASPAASRPNSWRVAPPTAIRCSCCRARIPRMARCRRTSLPGGRGFRLDFGRELLSVHDLRAQGFALSNTQGIDRHGAQEPGALKYGSASVGSILHTTAKYWRARPKPGFCTFLIAARCRRSPALLQGDIDFVAVTTGPISARLRAGEFRALAVTVEDPLARFSEVPTVEEQGIPGFEVISWTGLAGPAKLPQAHRRPPQRRTAPRRGRTRCEKQARVHGRRSARHDARRDACTGSASTRDLDAPRQGRRISRSIRDECVAIAVECWPPSPAPAAAATSSLKNLRKLLERHRHRLDAELGKARLHLRRLDRFGRLLVESSRRCCAASSPAGTARCRTDRSRPPSIRLR